MGVLIIDAVTSICPSVSRGAFQENPNKSQIKYTRLTFDLQILKKLIAGLNTVG
jgi:hypothetical protein